LEVEVESTINNENSLQKKKSNGGPIRGLLNRMKKYHIPIFSENGEKKVNKGIRHSQEKVKEQNIHINHSGVRSIENEHINVRRKLSKLNKNREISKNIYEKEINKIDLLKDFNIADYKIIKQIGQGTFGQIFMVEDKFHQNYALKKIIASSEIEIKGLKQEYQILYDIQSNLKDSKNRISIVNIYGLSTNQLDPTTYAMYVLMELGSCDWEKEVLERQKQKRYYTEQELMNILIVLVGTLAQLQKENISHRDIKPQNVLVFRNSNNVDYKLADFGEAKELLGGSKHTEKQTLRGTELYMSPILFYGLRSRKIKKYIKHNAYKSDVFSLGLCLLFAATLCFEVLYDIRELQNNVSVKIIIEKYLKKRYSYKIISIICSMLDINETTRDDFIELKARIEKI
jgi:serine/threonine protein kinase